MGHKVLWNIEKAQIIKHVRKYDVISFDIFDTLLIRVLNKPEEVFLLIGYNCKDIIKGTPKQFAGERKDAAIVAASNAKNGECTLYEIYENLSGYSEEEKKTLMGEELFIEQAVLKINQEVKAIYDECVKYQKTIIATSDMYLPESFLREVLDKNGYHEIAEIFVSCEQRANKHSGELFRLIEQKLGRKKYLHIGDSWRSDFINPRKSGWYSYHTCKPAILSETLSQVIQKKSASCYTGDYYSTIGYRVLGPILFEFCKWLKGEVEQRNISTILFFSRDGKILKTAFDLMFPEYDTKYFHISRKAVNVATLWAHPDFETLDRYIETTYSFNTRTFFKRIGLLNTNQYDNIGLNLDQSYTADQFWSDSTIKYFYDSKIKQNAIDNSKIQYKRFCKYFMASVKSGNLAIVDIGWRGSMQSRIEGLSDLLIDAGVDDIYGYYLGIESDESSKYGFLYNGKKQSNMKTIVDAGVGVFETLFLAREGTTLYYNESENVVIPTLADYEIKKVDMIENLERIHKAAIKYVSDMLQYKYTLEESDEARNCMDEFKKLCLFPQKEDLKKLGNIPFNDTEEIPIINIKGLQYYLKNLSKLKEDYHKAPWKIGFLKENIAPFITWGRLYLFMKNRGK